MGFDPIQYKTSTRQQWEDAAEAWHRWGPTLEQWLGESTDRMLDAAGVGPGGHVLDVAAGAGGQTLAAARRVGADGRVVATDVSPTILSYAAKAAAEAGLTNVETLSIIRTRAQLPPPQPGQPGPFSLGQPGTLEAALTAAGFRDVTVETVPAPLRMPSAAECVRFERESFGALHQMLASLPEAERDGVWVDIEDALGRFETPDGFVGPCEMLVAAGTK